MIAVVETHVNAQRLSTATGEGGVPFRGSARQPTALSSVRTPSRALRSAQWSETR